MTNETTGTWLTQEAYDRLKAELDEKSTSGRTEIAARIEAAREEGDLRENGGYHAAKEEQGKMEARIRQLEELLRHAQVGDAPSTVESVAAGTVVTAEMFGERSKFLIGSREIGQGTALEVYSEQSPLGSALVNHRAGDDVSYVAPNGKQISVKIVAIEPFTG